MRLLKNNKFFREAKPRESLFNLYLHVKILLSIRYSLNFEKNEFILIEMGIADWKVG